MGHTPGDDATCTDSQNCTVCGEELTPALGHTYKHTIQKPTCTEAGYTEHTCQGCGDKYRDHETNATGHRYGEWIVDCQPAPEVEGHRYAECQACGYRMEEDLPALPPVETETLPEEETVPIEPDTEPETEPDTESDTQEQNTETEPETNEETEGKTDTEPVLETDRDPSDSEHETKPEPEEETTAPPIALPEVKWYAKWLGAVGLPGLVAIAGMILGSGTAGIAVLIMRMSRKRRSKK